MFSRHSCVYVFNENAGSSPMFIDLHFENTEMHKFDKLLVSMLAFLILNQNSVKMFHMTKRTQWIKALAEEIQWLAPKSYEFNTWIHQRWRKKKRGMSHGTRPIPVDEIKGPVWNSWRKLKFTNGEIITFS